MTPHPSWTEFLREVEREIGRPVEWSTFERVFRKVATERGLKPGELLERADEIGAAVGAALAMELNLS